MKRLHLYKKETPSILRCQTLDTIQSVGANLILKSNLTYPVSLLTTYTDVYYDVSKIARQIYNYFFNICYRVFLVNSFQIGNSSNQVISILETTQKIRAISLINNIKVQTICKN